MIKLKTTSKKTFTNPQSRGNVTEFVYLKVNVDALHPVIKASGYYYFIDASGQVIKLDNIKKQVISYDQLDQLEANLLPSLNSSFSLIDNVKQRLEEVTKYVIDQEVAEGKVLNYGIASSNELQIEN